MYDKKKKTMFSISVVYRLLNSISQYFLNNVHNSSQKIISSAKDVGCGYFCLFVKTNDTSYYYYSGGTQFRYEMWA